MSAEEVHKATLCILAFSTAHVMTVDEPQGARCAWHDSSSRGRHEGRLGADQTPSG
jgi:hypothetical protein